MAMKTAYIMHPYWHEDEAVRQENVRRAGLLATAMLQLGYAVYSPLQASQGIEGALNEAKWLQHGIFWLTKCDIVVRPAYWERSNGCKSETAVALVLDKPIVDAAWSKKLEEWYVAL